MKNKKIYKCTECGKEYYKWVGRCECGQFDTVVEFESEEKNTKNINSISSSNIIKMKDIENKEYVRYSSGNEELDRVLGGGIVSDSYVIVAAPPGAGKTTLLTSVCNHVANTVGPVLYCSGEENENQVKSRADRICDDISENFYFYKETEIEKVLSKAKEKGVVLLVIDSINKMYSNTQPDNLAGGPNQIKAVSAAVMKFAKDENRKCAVFCIGQYTKTEQLAGPKSLEHDCDTFIELQNGGVDQLRFLQAAKNRFGEIDFGLLEMTEIGLVPADETSFLTDKNLSVCGNTITVMMEGIRPLLIEVQALVDKTAYGFPQRIAPELNLKTFQTYIAILEKTCGLGLNNQDVIVQVSGGFKIKETAASLAIMMAISSSFSGRNIPNTIAFIGEVALTGEIKKVTMLEQRIKYLVRKGYKTIYIPDVDLKSNFNDVNIIKNRHIKDVYKNVFLTK